jgi:preprotein translocase subunit Sss1
MENRYKRILKIHGITLLLLGSVMTMQTILGSFKGIGPLKFIYADPLRSVGLFEAYLLAAFSGSILLLLSGRHYQKEWHLLAATIHLILFVTNLLFWKAYALAGIVTIGYVATIAHALFIVLETSCYLLQKTSHKQNIQ